MGMSSPAQLSARRAPSGSVPIPSAATRRGPQVRKEGGLRPWSSHGGREPLSCSRYWCPGSCCRRAPPRPAPGSPGAAQGRDGRHGHGKGPEADPRGERALCRTRPQGGRATRRQGRDRDRHRTRRHEVRYVYGHPRRRQPDLGARPADGGGPCVGPRRGGGPGSRGPRGTNVDVRQEPLLHADQRHMDRSRSLLLQVQARQRRLDRIRLVRPSTIWDGTPQLTVGARPRTDPSVSKRRLVPGVGGLEPASRLVWRKLLDDQHRHFDARRRHLEVVRALPGPGDVQQVCEWHPTGLHADVVRARDTRQP